MGKILLKTNRPDPGRRRGGLVLSVTIWLSRDPLGEDAGINLYEYVGSDPTMRFDIYGLDWLDNAANFSAGVGDNLSFGITNWARNKLGINGGISHCSGWYEGGQWTGAGIQLLAGSGLGAEAAGAKEAGLEFSHWIPNRWGGPRSIFNGNYVTTAEHALSDPYRYRFMSAAWKEANPLPNQLIQQWNRIPNIIKGGAAGGAAGAASAGGQGCPCKK